MKFKRTPYSLNTMVTVLFSEPRNGVWDAVRRAPDLLVSCLIGSQVIGVVLALGLAGLVLIGAKVRKRGRGVET